MSSLHVHYEYADGSANTIRPTSVTYPDGRVLTYDYGTAGGMNDRLSRVESLGFDGTGNLVQPAYLGLGTQVRTTMSEPQVRWDLATGSSPNPYAGLDRFGRVIDNKWTNYNTTATLDQIKYTYDRASNRTSRENVVAKAQTPAKFFDELYSYDGSNRLTLMERGELNGTPPTSILNKKFAQDWELDATGNWKAFKEDGNGNGTWDLNQTRDSNPVNEIIAINETLGEPSWVTPGYDSAGNMTTIPRPAEPTGDFTGVYDAWNRLVELRGLDDTVVGRYEYDGLTRRVVKHTFPGWEELEAADWDAMTEEDWNGLQLTQAHRRDYYYNSSWQILEERVENDTAFDRQYVWGLQYIDGLVFRDRQLASSVERNYALQDANWNVTALTYDNGSVVERYSYSAYGVPTFLNPDFTPVVNNEAFDWDVLYAGYKWDAESALYQVRYRYLQPALGAWIRRDPVGYYSSDTSLYRYAFNNSINDSDKYGLFIIPLFIDPRPSRLLCWPLYNEVITQAVVAANPGAINYSNKYTSTIVNRLGGTWCTGCRLFSRMRPDIALYSPAANTLDIWEIKPTPEWAMGLGQLGFYRVLLQNCNINAGTGPCGPGTSGIQRVGVGTWCEGNLAWGCKTGVITYFASNDAENIAFLALILIAGIVLVPEVAWPIIAAIGAAAGPKGLKPQPVPGGLLPPGINPGGPIAIGNAGGNAPGKGGAEQANGPVPLPPSQPSFSDINRRTGKPISAEEHKEAWGLWEIEMRDWERRYKR